MCLDEDCQITWNSSQIWFENGISFITAKERDNQVGTVEEIENIPEDKSFRNPHFVRQ